MKLNREKRDLLRLLLPVCIAVIGLALLVAAQAEIASHPSYNWNNPSSAWSYSQYEYMIKTLRVKFVGIALTICPIYSAVMAYLDLRRNQKVKAEMMEYYIRGGFVTCPHCGLSVLGEIGSCPRCGETITPIEWDGNVDKLRTTLEVPMQTKNVDAVLEIMQNNFEMGGYKPAVEDGESIWSIKMKGFSYSVCVGAVFTGNSVLLQNWMKTRHGEKPQKQPPQFEKVAAMIRARKL